MSDFLAQYKTGALQSWWSRGYHWADEDARHPVRGTVRVFRGGRLITTTSNITREWWLTLGRVCGVRVRRHRADANGPARVDVDMEWYMWPGYGGLMVSVPSVVRPHPLLLVVSTSERCRTLCGYGSRA